MKPAMSATRTIPANKTYHLHRERQRRRILEAAEKLFDVYGIDRITMSEITAASGVRTSTTYQYFSSKDDIVWAILENLMADTATRAEKAMADEQTAFGKIAALLELMADDLVERRANVRFLAQFDAMYARDWPVERLLTIEARIVPDGFQHFAALVRAGIDDGSLRADLNPELTMHAVVNAAIGAQRRLASLGVRVEQEYGQPIDKLFRETIRVILAGLGPTWKGNSEKSNRS